MPPKEKAQQQAMAKKIEDKTFGMKNKNKSKAVQQQINQMKSSAGLNPNRNQDLKKEAASAAMNQLLFQEALTKKEVAAKKAAIAAAAIAKAEAKRAAEPDKKDIYTDTRDLKKEDDDMALWDDEKLKMVVEQKKGSGERVKTDIICKHFIDAVETRRYGWFWTCPNGGDKCQYRHALPEGFVLKRDQAVKDPFAARDEGPRLEDELEEKRKALTTRTPVTFERLQEWLANKKAAKAAKEEEELEAARKQYAKGKSSGVSGRMLFSIDASLFADDAAAGTDTYVRDESDDEGDVATDRGAAGAYLGGDDDTPALPTPRWKLGARWKYYGTEAPTEGKDIGKDGRNQPQNLSLKKALKKAFDAGVCKDGGLVPFGEAVKGVRADCWIRDMSGSYYVPATDDDAAGGKAEPEAAGAGTSEAADSLAEGGVEYGQNYEADKAVVSGAEVSAADLEGVDESLFLDEDLPDDVELE